MEVFSTLTPPHAVLICISPLLLRQAAAEMDPLDWGQREPDLPLSALWRHLANPGQSVMSLLSFPEQTMCCDTQLMCVEEEQRQICF